MTTVRGMLALVIMLIAGVHAGATQGTPLRTWQTWLRVAVTTEGETFDPHVNITSVSSQRMFPVYEGLLEYGQDGQIRPLLAQSWDVSPDGKQYTFRLRRDVRFSDGSPFNADAVKFNLDRLFALKKGPISLFEPVRSVRVVDPFTVQIELNETFAPFLSILAGSQARIFVSPAAVRAHAAPGDEWATKWLHTNTAGTGAYTLESWQPEDRVVLVRNQNYRGRWTDTHISRVTYQLVREPATAAQMLLRGDVDFLETVPIEFVGIFKRVSRIRVETVTSHGGRHQLHIFINSAKAPFDNPKVRQAMAYAVDYDRIIREAFDGLASPARGPIPQSFQPWYNPKATMYKRDLERARQLMREANVSTPVRVKLAWRGAFKEERTIGQIVKENLAAIGIDITLEEQTLPVWREGIWARTHDLFFFTQTMRYIDPDATLRLYYHSSNIRRGGFNIAYKNSQVDALLDRARTQLKPEERLRSYQRVQEIMTAEAAHLFLVDLKDSYATRDYVSGYEFNANYGIMLDAYKMRKDPAGFAR